MAWRKRGQTEWKGSTPGVQKVEGGGVTLVKGSPQQEAIWKALIEGDENIMVKALAGTGKTFTVIQGLHRIAEKRPDIKTAAFIAFNKSIATELQKKVPSWVTASTCHSLMFRALLYGDRKSVV